MSRTSATLAILLLAFAAQAGAPARGRILAVHAGADAQASSVYVLADKPLSFTTLKLAGPPRVVVDFADAEVAADDRELGVNDGVIRRVALAPAGSRTARLVIELAEDAEFEVRAVEKRLEVRVPRPAPQVAAASGPEGSSSAPAGPAAPAGTPPAAEAADEAEKRASLPKVALVGPHEVPTVAEASPEAPAALADAGVEDSTPETPPRPGGEPGGAAAEVRPAPARAAARDRKVALSGQRRSITGIGFRPVRGGEVIVRSDHPLEYGISGDGRAVLLHLPSAGIPLANNRRPLDTRFFDGPVQRVVPLAVAGGTDVRIELKDIAEYQLEQTGSVLTVTFAPSR